MKIGSLEGPNADLPAPDGRLISVGLRYKTSELSIYIGTRNGAFAVYRGSRMIARGHSVSDKETRWLVHELLEEEEQRDIERMVRGELRWSAR